MIRYWYLLRNLTGIDIGIGGFIRLLISALIPALLAAFIKGMGGTTFDWRIFKYVLCVAVLVIFLQNVLNSSVTFKDMLSPRSGRRFLNERKAAFGGIIDRININLAKGDQRPATEVREMLKEILDIIVLHVRDYRGNHSSGAKVVFASILIEREDKLMVVARDSVSHSPQYERPIPAIYKKSKLLCGQAMEEKKALSIGRLSKENPLGPQNKPYESILAIPLLGTQSEEAYGCLSIDCSRPYFFESFRPGQTENPMENSLQPYLSAITMILECFVSRTPEELADRIIPPIHSAISAKKEKS
jgi:hypothetical protein